MNKQILDVELFVNECLKKEQEKRSNRERSGKFSPSLFGGCYRRQIWNRLKIEGTNLPDERTLRVFKCGHLFHDFVQNLIPEKQTEVRIEEDDVLGFADIVLLACVVEVKSQHSRAFWYMEKEDYSIEIKKRGNILQNMYYCLRLGKPYGILCFISKDDLCIKQFLLRLEDWEDEVNKELEKLRFFWAKSILPEAEPRLYPDKNNKPVECKYCNFYDLCQKTGKETRSFSDGS